MKITQNRENDALDITFDGNSSPGVSIKKDADGNAIVEVNDIRVDPGSQPSGIGFYSGTTIYSKNQLVIFTGEIYKSLIDNNKGNNPLTVINCWEKISCAFVYVDIIPDVSENSPMFVEYNQQLYYKSLNENGEFEYKSIVNNGETENTPNPHIRQLEADEFEDIDTPDTETLYIVRQYEHYTNKTHYTFNSKGVDAGYVITEEGIMNTNSHRLILWENVPLFFNEFSEKLETSRDGLLCTAINDKGELVCRYDDEFEDIDEYAIYVYDENFGWLEIFNKNLSISIDSTVGNFSTDDISKLSFNDNIKIKYTNASNAISYLSKYRKDNPSGNSPILVYKNDVYICTIQLNDGSYFVEPVSDKFTITCESIQVLDNIDIPELTVYDLSDIFNAYFASIPTYIHWGEQICHILNVNLSGDGALKIQIYNEYYNQYLNIEYIVSDKSVEYKITPERYFDVTIQVDPYVPHSDYTVPDDLVEKLLYFKNNTRLIYKPNSNSVIVMYCAKILDDIGYYFQSGDQYCAIDTNLKIYTVRTGGYVTD